MIQYLTYFVLDIHKSLIKNIMINLPVTEEEAVSNKFGEQDDDIMFNKNSNDPNNGLP